jgi:hypothetical protein
VGLVDGKQRQRQGLQQRQGAFAQQPFRRHVQQLQIPGAQPLLHRALLFEVESGVQKRGFHARLAQRRHLVAHQRDQRRHHHRDAFAQQRGDLVAKGFPAAGRHQHQAVAPGKGVRDDRRLLAAETVVSEDPPEHVPGRRGHGARLSH